ncbi:phosphatidylinositol-4- kinase [Coemansia sp. RSA 1199]|nr:phosphatidylinositol-4- kinase [Coemansia sp. RSA 1199]
MECMELHSLILEELSGILAELPVTDSKGSEDGVSGEDGENSNDCIDPAVERILAQCPMLPTSDSTVVVSRRHENGILALANLVRRSADSVRAAALDRVLAYLDALPAYNYQFSAFGVGGVPTEHWFVERLVARLLACAAAAPDIADVIVDRIWAHLDRIIDVLQAPDRDRTVVFGLPAFLGTVAALEKTRFRFRASDVMRADALAARLLAADIVDNVHAAVSASQAAATPVRRTVSLYLQRGVGLSANHMLAQFLAVLRSVLESRIAVRLAAGGEPVGDKDPRQLWDLISQCPDFGISQQQEGSEYLYARIGEHMDASDNSVQLYASDDEQRAYARILAFSLQTYGETRMLVSKASRVDSGAPAQSTLATGTRIMSRCIYAATLASLLLGSLDPRVLGSIFEHMASNYTQRLANFTVACFRVLVPIATFFASSRDLISAAVSRFLTEPSAELADELPQTGAAAPAELMLVEPAAAALAAALHSRARAVSGIHTLFNALAVHRAVPGSSDRHSLRVARNIILALAQLALAFRDSEVTTLVVSMICAPRFTGTPALTTITIQSAADVATVAAHPVFDDIVGAALKRITFGNGSDADAVNVSASATLTALAWKVGVHHDIVEAFFAAALRSFIDASVEAPAPSHMKRQLVTPLSVFLPILHALVRADAYAGDRNASAEQIMLWRAFWFHMVARGYLLDKTYVAAYGAVYADLAARSPILVHPSSVNYLEAELECSSVFQREAGDAALTRLRQALAPLVGPQSQTLLRNIGFAHAAFLLAVYRVEIVRAEAGCCATVLRYFSNSAVTSSSLLPAIENIAGLVIAAYVRETTSRRWSVEASLAASGVSKPSLQPVLQPRVIAQIRELMVASCHHLELVSTWGQRFVDRILRAFPQALLDKSVVCTLLELVQLVWKSCKAEQDDQFVPVYWFTSRTLGITLQFPDSITYRKTLFAQFSACARRWLELVVVAAPMELETLLQAYLATPCDDDDLNYEPHIGRALALEVATGTNYSSSAADFGAVAVSLPPNASPFTYRLGQRGFLRGRIGHSTDVQALKRTLTDAYILARENPGAPLPEGAVSLRAVSDAMSHATHYAVAAPHVDRELLRLLVWVPLTLLDDGLMRATRHMWTTLIVERADTEVLVMVELTIAWTWLIQQHLGLFSQHFEPKNPFAAKMSYTPSDKSARARAYAAISRTLAPHMQVIEFVVQRFDAVKHLPYGNFSVVNAILRILQVSFDNQDHITTNALARGPLFMLVHLGFKLLKLGFESNPILEAKLRDGLYRLAFRWFALPPCWSFSGSKPTLAREIQILIDTRHTIKGDTPVLRSAPVSVGKWSATGSNSALAARASYSSLTGSASSGNSSSTLPMTPLNASKLHHYPHLRHLNPLSRHRRHVNKTPGQAVTNESSTTTSASSLPDDESDLILNLPREQLKQRALRMRSLLLLLIENEICRMATWANPTDQKLSYFPDVSRFARTAEMTEQGWQNLVVDAWVANPRLAVQLTKRFSHPAIARELTSLICKFPGELVLDPEALPLLIDQLRSGSVANGGIVDVTGAPNGMFNNLSSPLSFRELKFLLYWSPVPPITSTAYLASSFSSHPLALQYTMRALECFPVDITFFYIPQLVQALRHDVAGYAERAILSSAQISQHFAHQIIWNMNANMYKDEESLVPDALKPALDRIISTIVSGLSGEDRTYYEKEFGFFNKVTGISGKLKPFIKKSKVEKKRKIDEEMRCINVEPGVYLPSNPDGTVVDIDYDSGRPLQSHAKAPFMATFVVSKPRESADEVQELLKRSERTLTPSAPAESEQSSVVSGENSNDAVSALPAIPESSPLGGHASGIFTADTKDEKPNAGGMSSTVLTPRSQDVDAQHLSSKLAGVMIQLQRTLSSSLSDAPDLIGISPHEQIRSGRPSRDSARSHKLAAAKATDRTQSSTPRKRGTSGSTPPPAKSAATTGSHTTDSSQVISRLSAIFKVGDDCRQDVLALQLIAVFKNIFTSCGLDLYLYPYRVVATAPGCGVIDVIPNSISRDQMGREKVNSLGDYFATKYGGVDSIQYQQARNNFVQSLAAYSVLSYLLQFKDRHNGNIMLDDEGHIVHIDFGFILDIAPGGITFESAPFKLTAEYVHVMGGGHNAQPYELFCELCIKAYLASRPYADKIVQIVALMIDSGLPCFKGEATLSKLRSRFQLDRSDREAALFMADRIADSYENKRTVMYDQFQKATNGIPY